MPYKKNYSKKKGRKRVTKASPKEVTGIPDKQFVKLRYTSFFNVNPATPTGGHVFRGNSINDPDFTGIGAQPLGHDEWAAFYGKYKVHSSKIQVQFLNANTTSGAGNVLLNIVPSNSINTIGSRTYAELNDTPYSKTKMIAPVSAGMNGVYMSNYMSTKKMTGDTTLDDVYEAPFNNNPNRTWYWIVQTDSFNGTSGHDLDLKVTITYYVEIFDRKMLLQS